MNLNDAITRPNRVGTGLLLQSIHARKAMRPSSASTPGRNGAPP